MGTGGKGTVPTGETGVGGKVVVRVQESDELAAIKTDA
jgi:hypothetical protein